MVHILGTTVDSGDTKIRYDLVNYLTDWILLNIGCEVRLSGFEFLVYCLQAGAGEITYLLFLVQQ